MNATSPNGWPVSPNADDLNITPLEIAGVQFAPGVRGGKVHEVLSYVAEQVHKRVQRVRTTYGNYGYSFRENVNSPGVWSNHASGTAIDFNASLNPNGVPVTECFSPEQIAEVHAILAEVDNVVRWGGDYTSTPDSMHFEIDVTPQQLEGSNFDFPTSGTQWPIGSPTFPPRRGELPELTENSVSYPTLAIFTYPYSGAAYWQYTATSSGRVSIDALLSHYTDKEDPATDSAPQVYLYLYKLVDGNREYVAGSSNYTDPGTGWSLSRGRIFTRVEEGQTYLIESYTSYANQQWPYVRMVVRIGEIVPDPDWVQPPDQTREWAHDQSSRPPTTGRKIFNLQWGTGFRGNDFDIYRSFGGPNVNTERGALECSWRWGRRMWANAGVVWWSPDNGVEWDGGPGACPVFTGQIDKPSSFGTGRTTFPAGWVYNADGGGFGVSDSLRFTVYGGAGWLNPYTFVTQERRNGQGWSADSQATYLPTLKQGEYIEWESETCELVDLDVSFDQVLSEVNNTHRTATVAKWYMGPYDTSQTHVPGVWEPMPSTWYGQGGDTPENYAASQQHMGDTAGGFGSWQDVPAALWEGRMDSTGSKMIRFTVLCDRHLSDDPPGVPAGAEVYKEDYLEGLTLAFKTTVRPSRYRYWEDPGLPDIRWAGYSAITLTQEDAGRALF